MVILWIIKNVYLNPGSPVVKTLCIHCWGYRFNPWLGKFYMPQYAAKKKKKRFTYIAYFYFSHPHIVFIFIQLKANSRMNTTFSNSRWAFLILEGSDEFNRHRFSDF